MTVIHDRYRVIQSLSSTLYGWVFTCEDFQSPLRPSTANVPVVIKQVSLERMASFMKENPVGSHTPDNPIVEKEVGDIIRAAGGHPNLVQYTDSFIEGQSLYLVMEHCADGDMYDYLSRRRQRTMSCLNALSVLSQVAAGLVFLHQHGIAHRDISLENIMLHRGRCKLGDFGLATRARRGGGRQVGKDYYMAPEIVAGELYDPKAADIWSLGITFFIMLTGSPLVSFASMSVKSFRALKQAGISTVLEAWGGGGLDDPQRSAPVGGETVSSARVESLTPSYEYSYPETLEELNGQASDPYLPKPPTALDNLALWPARVVA